MKQHPVPSGPQFGAKLHPRTVVVRVIAGVALAIALIAGAVAQVPDPAEVKLPNGKSQSNAIAQADYKNNLRDAKELARLSAEIQSDLETGDPFVLPLKTLKKVE